MTDLVDRFLKDPPTIETDRLIFRPICADDADDMFEYACTEAVTRYLLWPPHPDREYTRRMIRRLPELFREGGFFDWAAVRKSDLKMIGTAGYAQIDRKNNLGEIGYVLSQNCWHMGYGTEIASKLIAFGFSYFGFNRIQARYMIGNDHSRAVMEKCGMHYEGTARESIFVKGAYRDIGVCSILRSEYPDAGAPAEAVCAQRRRFFRH